MTSYEYLPLSSIFLPPSRQRSEPAEDHIAELALSIETDGLLHAPILDEKNQLIAGFCRLKAIETLMAMGTEFYYNGKPVPPGTLPIVRTHKTDPAELFRIELEENLRRKNLSIMEQALAISTLHKMLLKANPYQSKEDTRLELEKIKGEEVAQKAVVDAVLLSQFADDPDVKKARTKGIAVRIAKRKLEQMAVAGLGIEVDTTLSRHEVIHADAHKAFSEIPPGSFDAIITDPPYGVSAEQFGTASFQAGGHQYSDSEEASNAAYHLLAYEGYWKVREQGHLFAFCEIRRFPKLAELFSAAGWRVWPTPLIWFKGSVAHAPIPDLGPKRSYEAILFAIKGDKKLQKLGLDVLQTPPVFRDDKLHAAEKPARLYEDLLSWVLVPGSKILDPFCGSGPIFSAAESLGCDAVGIEISEQYVNICRARISELTELDPLKGGEVQ